MTRSNRALTQFVIGKIDEYLDLGPERFVNAAGGNTSVTLTRDGDADTLGVWLFDQPIAELFFLGGRFEAVAVIDGSFYDKAGRPSRTTRERLNGILDHLGEICFIPGGVRVFIDPEDERTYVGRQARRPITVIFGFPLILSKSACLIVNKSS